MEFNSNRRRRRLLVKDVNRAGSNASPAECVVAGVVVVYIQAVRVDATYYSFGAIQQQFWSFTGGADHYIEMLVF